MKKHIALLLTLPLILLGCAQPQETEPPAEKTPPPAKITTEIPQAAHTPYGGTPLAIPGTLETEHYDDGPAEIAYHDIDAENLGEPYRTDTQVDIEKRPDASNGHGIGWTRTGEWLLYTINITQPGTYDLTIPVASNKEGGTFHLQLNDDPITDPIQIPDTGGWQKLQTITDTTKELPAGTHTLKLSLDTQGPSGSIGDIDYIKFELKP